MPTKRALIRAVVAPTLQWIVNRMRQLEEWSPDPAERWERLRDCLEGIARERDDG